jgi:hypothetical protein
MLWGCSIQFHCEYLLGDKADGLVQEQAYFIVKERREAGAMRASII